MSSEANFPTQAASGFLEEWKRHPLAVPVILVIFTFTFLAIFLHDRDKPDLSRIVISTLVFSVLVIGGILFILYRRKNVFYNELDAIISEVNRHIRSLQETLGRVEIGVGSPFEDALEASCPASSREPLSQQTRMDVHAFTLLCKMLRNCGLVELTAINDHLRVHLAKFFYKAGQYEDALEWINEVKDWDAAEKNFYKGLILFRLNRCWESREEFEKAEKAGHPLAGYHRFALCVNADHNTIEKLEELVEEGDREPNLKLNENAMIKVAQARHKQSKLDDDPGERKRHFEDAVRRLRKVIDESDKWTAHYNLACYLSFNAQTGSANFNWNKNIDDVLHHLKKAFQARPQLIEYCKTDPDLTWIREHAANEYFSLVGMTHHRGLNP